MKALTDYFGRVVIVSMRDREDRRERLRKHLREMEVVNEPDVFWYDAVDGRKDLPPEWWKAGKGAWGCRESHVNIVSEALRDGVESVLILEDDVVFHKHTLRWLELVFDKLPRNWDLFYLGGQHMEDAEETDEPMILKGEFVTRTHAYAIHGRAFVRYLERLGGEEDYRRFEGWHLDHVLGVCQMEGELIAYAPAWWFAGQEVGASDIAGMGFDRRWWQPEGRYWDLPFVEFSGESGYLYRPPNGPPEGRMARALWLREVAKVAWMQGRLPSLVVAAPELQALWPGGWREVSSEEELADLADYPSNGLLDHPFNIPINIL